MPGGPIQNIDYWNSVSGRGTSRRSARTCSRAASSTTGDGADATAGRGRQSDHGPDLLAERERDRPPRADRAVRRAVANDRRRGGGYQERRHSTAPPARSCTFRSRKLPRSAAAYLVIRTKGDPMAIASAVRSEIRSARPRAADREPPHDGRSDDRRRARVRASSRCC